MNQSAIKKWARANKYKFSEDRGCEVGFSNPDGSFLVINPGHGEAPFWSLYYPPGDGEQSDEDGSWDEIPDYEPKA